MAALRRMERHLTGTAQEANYLVDLSNVVRDRSLGGRSARELRRLRLVLRALRESTGDPEVTVHAIADNSLLRPRHDGEFGDPAEGALLREWRERGLIAAIDKADPDLLDHARAFGTRVISSDNFTGHRGEHAWVQGDREHFLRPERTAAGPVRLVLRDMGVFADRQVSREGEQDTLKARNLLDFKGRPRSDVLGRSWHCPLPECRPSPAIQGGKVVCRTHRTLLTDTGPRRRRIQLKILVDGTCRAWENITEGPSGQDRQFVLGRGHFDRVEECWLAGDRRRRISREHLLLRTWRVLAAGLAGALHSIHDAGLVHRDLKLANVLLAADGAYVIDFGIARHLSPSDGRALTGTGSGPRTTSFAAPEQLRDERVGPAGDVFALGVVLAYTALNRHPFGTGSAMEIGANILTDRPSLDGLPAEVEKVVRPCLEPEPGKRPTPAEITDMLAGDASPQARDWLSPGLRAMIDRRSRFAIDIDRPLRPRSSGSGAAVGAALGLTVEPTPQEAGAAPGARALRERELTAAPAVALTETEVPARPAALSPDRTVVPGTKDIEGRTGASIQTGDVEAMRQKAARRKKAGDLEAALLWYRRAADAGNPTAAREAAQLIEKHFPDRRSEALPFYRMAAEGGEAFARTRLTELQAEEQQRPAQAAKESRAPTKTAATAGAQKAKSQAGKPISAEEQTLLRQHRAAAMEGQLTSVLALANWYKHKKRDEEGLVWFRRAAEAGDPYGMYMTAHLLSKDRDHRGESVEWFRKAADAGHTGAMHRAGILLAREGHRADALHYFRAGADKGHGPCRVQIARTLAASGEPDQALEWLDRATDAGNKAVAAEVEHLRAKLHAATPAQVPTGAPPPGPSPAQPARKATAAQKAAPAPKNTRTQTGVGTGKPSTTGGVKVSALRRAAVEYEKRGRLQQALDSYAQAAEQPGDTASKRDVARLCLALSTSADSPNDRRRFRKRAVRLHRRLAQDGDPQSIRVLAELGLTVDSRDQHERQLEVQLRVQLQAAGEGSSKAMRAVARTYLRLGGEEYVQAALSWLRLAGETGNTGAMLEGARVFEELGQHREALEWYRWAEESGDGSAVPHIQRLAAEHPGAALVSRLSRRLRRAWS